jgi:hypothetical protein
LLPLAKIKGEAPEISDAVGVEIIAHANYKLASKLSWRSFLAQLAVCFIFSMNEQLESSAFKDSKSSSCT